MIALSTFLAFTPTAGAVPPEIVTFTVPGAYVVPCDGFDVVGEARLIQNITDKRTNRTQPNRGSHEIHDLGHMSG